jgi:ABC-type antimicrobial peptide transport system permease subunit
MKLFKETPAVGDLLLWSFAGGVLIYGLQFLVMGQSVGAQAGIGELGAILIGYPLGLFLVSAVYAAVAHVLAYGIAAVIRVRWRPRFMRVWAYTWVVAVVVSIVAMIVAALVRG